MALTASSIGSGSGTASSWTSASFTCSAGDLLIVGVTVGNNDAAQLISSVSDNSGSGTWVMLGEANSSVFDAKWWYKIANGSETTVTTTFTSSWAYDAVAAKVTGWTNTATLEDVDEDTSYLTTATTTSIGGGSVTNATASAMALMFVANDGSSLMDAGRSVSDGASYSEVVTSGAQIFLWAHAKSSTGTYSPVYSFTDSGDQAYGASAVFGDASAGSNYTLTGAVTHTLTPAASFAINRQHSIAGAVTLTLTPSATLDIDRAYTLSGAVTLSLTPAASMAYTAAGSASINGAVTYTLTPAATFAINRAYTLTGAVSHTLAVAASMQYTAQQAIEFVGAVTYTLTPSAVMVGPAIEAESASLAGLRVHAAREMPFFFRSSQRAGAHRARAGRHCGQRDGARRDRHRGRRRDARHADHAIPGRAHGWV